MRRSRRRERFSTYQTSSSMRSSQGSCARPCTWATARKAGLHLEPPPLPLPCRPQPVGERGPRSNEAHFALQDVPRAGEARPRRGGADSRPTRVIRRSPSIHGPARAEVLRADDHRPQLEELEILARPPVSGFAAEGYRPRSSSLIAAAAMAHERRRSGPAPARGAADVENALGCAHRVSSAFSHTIGTLAEQLR